MRILLINTNQEKLPQPIMPIGVCCVATALAQRDHKVHVIDPCFSPKPYTFISQTIHEYAPDVIGLSIRNIDNSDLQYPRYYLPKIKNLIETIKASTTAPIILGGSAIGVAPLQTLEYLDCALGVVGEGEVGAVELLEALANDNAAKAPGAMVSEDGRIVVRGVPKKDDHSYTSPARVHRWLDLRPYRRYKVPIPIQTKRGCVLNCTYCTYRNLEGTGYRLKTPCQVVTEIAEIVHDTDYRFFEFVDSTFNHPAEHAMAVCEAIISSGLKVKLQGSVNPLGLSSSLLGTMKRAGFDSLVCTPDSASEQMLANLSKGFTRSELETATKLLHAIDLPVMWCFLFGGPGETALTTQETFRFAEVQLTNRDVVFLSTGIRIYPGTTLATQAMEEGTIDRTNSLLEPTFYFSPELSPDIFDSLLMDHLSKRKNYIKSSDLQLSFLPAFQRIAGLLGLMTPLWQYATLFNRFASNRRLAIRPNARFSQQHDKVV